MADFAATKNVKTRDCLDDKVLFPSQSATSCAFCAEKNSKYTCPRCNSRYCSCACYKSEKHLRCSELFYKECVLDAMIEQQGNLGDRGKMLEMLQKLEENMEVPEAANAEGIEERMAGIDIYNDPQAVWSALTEAEREEFESAVKSGEIFSIIDVWLPWWILEDDTGKREKIEDITKENNGTNKKDPPGNNLQTTTCNTKDKIPPTRKNIPPLSLITKQTTPNPNIQFSLVDVLFSYAYIMRLYNGCPEENLEQATENLMQLSPVLSKSAVFYSVESVVYSCLNAVQHSKDLCSSDEFSYTSLLDVVKLIKGYINNGGHRVVFVECALSHILKLLSKGREKLREQSDSQEQSTDLCKSMWLAKKKVEFLLSWVHSNVDPLQCLVPYIEKIHAEVSTSYKQHNKQKEMLEQEWGGPIPPKKVSELIEEI